MTPEFLLMCFDTQQPRRQRVIFGLLTNHLTVSTAFNGLAYQLLALINLHPQLTKEQYDQMLRQLVEQNAIQEIEPGMFLKTEQGSIIFQQAKLLHYYPECFIQSGHANIIDFRNAFLLANQVISEHSFKNKKYYPVLNNLILRDLVKQWFQVQKQTDLIFNWVQELQNFLKTLPEMDANRLANTWTGHQQPGLRPDQLMFPATWNEADIYYWEIDQYAKMAQYLEQVGEQQSLKQLWQPFTKTQHLSSSMWQTYQVYTQKMSIERISKIRNLKIGTVREHLLSAAVFMPLDQFNYQLLLTPPLISYFEEHLQGSPESWAFQSVRLTGDPDEFFYFRLYQIQQVKQNLLKG